MNDPEPLRVRVGRRISELRRERGWTQETFAELLETAPRNLQRIEAGQNLTLATVERVAALLGVEPHELLR